MSTEPLDHAVVRAHTITATPMANGRGGLQYHCTTCGTLTYFQPPTLPCLGSLSEAHATIERLRAENAIAWATGHSHPWRRGPDECRCGAWAKIECACGRYGTGELLSLADNPYLPGIISTNPPEMCGI